LDFPTTKSPKKKKDQDSILVDSPSPDQNLNPTFFSCDQLTFFLLLHIASTIHFARIKSYLTSDNDMGKNTMASYYS
jgi:hypothetical protein